MSATKREKRFFEMSPPEKAALVEELAKGFPFGRMRPLSKRGRALWDAAKRGRGRPPKPPGMKAKRVNLTFDPALLEEMNAYSRANHISRAELVARGVKLAMGK
jgi:hypothetical protein